MNIGIQGKRRGVGIVVIIGSAQEHLPRPAQVQRLVPQPVLAHQQQRPVQAQVPVLQQVRVQQQLVKKYYVRYTFFIISR